MISLGTGAQALQVSRLGFGCMGLTAFYGTPVSNEHGVAVLRKAFDLGVRHFDTAQMYRTTLADGSVKYNESLVGAFLKTLTEEEKKDVTVATKFNPFYDGGLERFDNAAFMKSVDDSLERLGMNCVDLFYMHRIYPEDKVPVEAWMGAMKEVVEAGKVRCLGLSEAPAHIIRKAHSIYPLTCIQQEWSLFARDLEKSLVPTCKELGIGIIAYSPIGRGFLAGAFDDKTKVTGFKSTVPFMSKDHFDDNAKLLEEMKAMAEKKGCSLGALCLAWVMAMGSVPIPGTRSIHHLEDNMKALDVVLTEAEIANLGNIGNKVKGERGSAAYMSSTFTAREKL